MRHSTVLPIARVLAVLIATCLLIPAPARAADRPPTGALAPEAGKQRIQQHRTAQATLTLTGVDGKPLANAAVTIRQTRHQFLFGCNGFGIKPADTSELQQAYHARFAEILNFATMPFYWGAYENAEGKPGVERVRAMAQWCAERGIATKGHPLCWQQVAPKWLEGKPLEDVYKLQLARVTRDVAAFPGLIDTWDVVNEAVAMPNYKGETTPIPAMATKVGVAELLKQCFANARAANPKATLLLNDYDTSPKFEKLIADCLAAQMPIDVIGIQSHQHTAVWGGAKAWEVCERFARFGKPLHFTETTFISAEPRKDMRWGGPNFTDWLSSPEGEEKQAKRVEEFYTTLFSHPAVQAITWWDFSDRGAWLGAPAGLVRKDMTPKPAYDVLKRLIKQEWWTAEVKGTTDAEGRVTFRGFLGDYAVETVGGAATFRLDRAGVAAAAAQVKRP